MKQECKFTLAGMLKFELISLYGRHFSSFRKPHLQQNLNYLNLGCGINFQEAMGGGII